LKIPRELAGPLDDLLTRAFAEDGEDVTSLAVFGPAARVAGRLVAREAGVVCGVALLPRIFAFLRPTASARPLVEDGSRVTAGEALAEIEGPAITVLKAERVALNLLQRLSGIATLTRRYAEALEGTGAILLDTRKTTPGLRTLERYAVRCGGGTNHRFGLAHGFLVKDNHADGSGSVWEATRRAADFRATNPSLRRLLLEVEARTRDEVHQALEAGAERILLDNMGLDETREAVADVKLWNEATGHHVETEGSGGMTPEKARAAAEAGVDFVSVGALTHSARGLDLALDVSAALPLRERRISRGRLPRTSPRRRAATRKKG